VTGETESGTAVLDPKEVLAGARLVNGMATGAFHLVSTPGAFVERLVAAGLTESGLDFCDGVESACAALDVVLGLGDRVAKADRVVVLQTLAVIINCCVVGAEGVAEVRIGGIHTGIVGGQIRDGADLGDAVVAAHTEGRDAVHLERCGFGFSGESRAGVQRRTARRIYTVPERDVPLCIVRGVAEHADLVGIAGLVGGASEVVG